MTPIPSVHPDIAWYRKHLRPLVSRHLPDREGEWDQEAAHIEFLLSGKQEELPVCFLGASGVGKSTLINALVTGKDIVLPAAGVGPLTAQAILVRYGKEAAFEVEYHQPTQVARILWPLEQSWKRERRLDTSADDPSQLKGLLSQEDIETGRAFAKEMELGSREATFSRLDTLRKQARQLITGNQDDPAELPYILDGLRQILGRSRISGTTLRPQSGDGERIHRLQEALVMAKERKMYRQSSTANANFKEALKEHASGFLAPLIRRIDVTWDSSLLQHGLTLIDLPGVGASGDSFKVVTREYIPQSRAVVLVVNRSGIDQASADLLRSSGFINRLIYAGDRPQDDPVQLVVAAVHIDDVAEERFAEDDGREKHEYLEQVRCEMRTQLQNQLREHLQAAYQETMGAEPFTEREQQAIEILTTGMQIRAVSAIQHRRFLRARPGDPAFITELRQSGIPEMQESLIAVAREAHERRRREAARSLDSFLERVISRLEEFRPLPREQQKRILAAKTRQEFLAYVQQQREEYLRREGQLRALWTEGVKDKIQLGVKKGSERASQRIIAYLGTLADAKVSVRTLQAAVRYGGRFSGKTRTVDLPHDLSLGFDAVMAEVWNDSVLRDLRDQTTKFASDCAALIEEIVIWAKDHELTDLLQPLEAHARTIRADAELLKTVGEMSVGRLREQVRDRLIAEIEPAIAERCRKFGTSGLAEGTGTKQRILEMFRELARDVIESAQKLAIQLMSRCVEGVRESVTAVWKNRDPLARAEELGRTPPPSPKPTEMELRREREWKEIEAALAARPGAELRPQGEVVGAGS